jgi:hypothetical protein
MKLLYLPACSIDKTIDMLLPGYICFCPARRRKTVLHKMNNCYLTLATAYNGLRTKEVAEGNLDKVKRSLLSIVSWSCSHKMKRIVELINHP